MARVSILLALATLVAPTGRGEDKALEHARSLLQEAILIDGHNDLPWAIREYERAPRDVVAYDLRTSAPGNTDFARLAAGGLSAQFWSVYVPGEDKALGYARVQLEQIDIARRIVARYPDRLAFCSSADDVLRAKREGKIGSLLGMEGGHAIENSLGALRAYYDLGVRYMTLTHNTTLDWADAAGDVARHGGLTRFGEEVVGEMNRLGMLVDLSHTAPGTMDDALRIAQAPVIFSHSSAKAICNVPRNVPDEVLKRLPANGGVVMVTFVAGFVSQRVAEVTTPLWREYRRRTAGVSDPTARARIQEQLRRAVAIPKATIAEVADHIDHVRKVAGVEHVGIGGDYDGNTDWPEGLEDVSKYPALFAELIRRGWLDADLKRLAGENVLRALRQAEATARRLQAERPASTATIEQLDVSARAGREAQ
jgi:membrane dipeptidase